MALDLSFSGPLSGVVQKFTELSQAILKHLDTEMEQAVEPYRSTLWVMKLEHKDRVNYGLNIMAGWVGYKPSPELQKLKDTINLTTLPPAPPPQPVEKPIT